MAFEVIKARDHVALGNYIKALANGTEPKPTTVSAMKMAADAHGAGLTFPTNILPGTKVEIRETDNGETSNSVLFLIPTADLIERAEAALGTTFGRYDIPPFYDMVYEQGAVRRTDLDHGEKLKILMSRIGEYCIGRCM